MHKHLSLDQSMGKCAGVLSVKCKWMIWWTHCITFSQSCHQVLKLKTDEHLRIALQSNLCTICHHRRWCLLLEQHLCSMETNTVKCMPNLSSYRRSSKIQSHNKTLMLKAMVELTPNLDLNRTHMPKVLVEHKINLDFKANPYCLMEACIKQLPNPTTPQRSIKTVHLAQS